MDKTIAAAVVTLFVCLSARTTNATTSLRSELNSHKGADFRALIEKWQDERGENAVPELIALSRDAKLEDTTRYVALMAAAKLGGEATTNHLFAMLEDRSWMIRSAALRGLILVSPDQRTPLQDQALVATLRDRALVVRREAVQAIAALKPRGSVDALLRATTAPENYVQGKAQWIPQSALAALAQFRSPADRATILQALDPVANRTRDPRVKLATRELRKQLTDR